MRITKSHFLSATALSAMIAGMFAVPAAAQNTAQAGQLEEIIVTARKTEERLQDVPISITAFTDRELTERGLKDVFQISQFTPGFSFEKMNRYGVQAGGTRPTIRGMSQILGEANAAFFIDGILFTDNPLSFPFDIVDRVEVIKGPQAALFGRSTFAGAVNLITKKGTNDFQSQFSVRAAEYDDYEANFLSRGPIMKDKVFYMLSGRWYDFGGQYKNYDGRTVGQESSHGVNGSLEFHMSDNFTASVSGGYNKDEDGHSAVVLQDRFANNCFLNSARQYYCGQVQTFETTSVDLAGLQGAEGLHRNSTRINGTLSYDAGGWSITSNTGGFHTHSEFGVDASYQGATAIAPAFIPGTTVARAATDVIRVRSVLRNEVQTRDEWSEEVRVQTAQDQRIRFLAGAFYYQMKRPFQERHFDASAPTVDSGIARTNNHAVFGSATVDLTDQWNASAEMRYATDIIRNKPARITAAGADCQYVPDGGVFDATIHCYKGKFNSWTPRFTSNYKFDQESMVYVTVAKGNKPGFINPDPRLPESIRYASEESSWNYEVGTKNTLLGGKLIANLAAYYIAWNNQQLTTTYVVPGTTNTVNYVVNAGKSDVKGLEMELTGVFNEYLTGGFTYGLTDAKFISFNDPEALDLFGNASVAGKSLPNTPKHQASLFGRFSYPVTDEISTFIRGDVSYTERKFDQIYNLAYNGDQYLVNVKMGVESDSWTFTFFVNNLTDDRTPSTVIRFVDQMNLNVAGAPQRLPAQVNTAGSLTSERGFQYPLADKRRFGVTATYKF